VLARTGHLVAWTALLVCVASADMRADFASPPREWSPRPLWFWNAPPSEAETDAIMEGCGAIGYAGFGILPTPEMGLSFMGPEYLDRYEEAVAKAAALRMRMCLYDEFWFPSGSAGGLLTARYPEALSKRLDLTSADVSGPATVRLDAPAGTPMAAVAMNAETLERLDLSGYLRDGRLEWEAPPGPWKAMLFTCVPDGARGLVDYLDREAVARYVSLTYEPYYQRLGRYFGSTIDSAFYDEPTFHWVQGGRAWTPAFSARFGERRGYDPSLLYPALWFDIGPETASARNALFGFRAELFADGFVRTIADWCQAHGVALTGHVDQEEVVNPTGLCGDLIRCFQDQPIPGIDQIGTYGRASKAYKIVSSAATNYDRRLVMTECYGAMDLPVPNLYREAMDQFAKGINLMVPHAVWYSTRSITFPPELSYRTEPYATELPAYNHYIARLQRVLQQGHPVVDIGVLYPIAGLQAGYRFDVGTPYEGGVIPPEADYMDVGEQLSLSLRHDFTFVHPATLDARCTVRGEALVLQHPEWSQHYRVFVVPGGTAVSASNLLKLKLFYDQGGKVIFTTCLPRHSTEPGRGATVRTVCREMLGAAASEPSAAFAVHENARGGKAYFVPTPDTRSLTAVLADALPAPDVRWDDPPTVAGGNLSCLHKTIGGRDVYFFANSSDTQVDTTVTLRGGLEPELWDPHTGTIGPVEHTRATADGEPLCRVRLQLPAVRSTFVVSRTHEP
jgi:hypothetical protein